MAIELGLDKQIERVTTNPWQGEDVLLAENPLSKIPTLITDDGMVLYDSRVICEYLDTLHNGKKLIPDDNAQHWYVLRLQALSDGILDAGILRFMESNREAELQSKSWDAMQKGAIERGLAYLETIVEGFPDELNLGLISVGCMLGWLDFRLASEDWRTAQPKLAAWFASFATRQSMQQTIPVAM